MSPRTYLEPPQWYASLPTSFVSACVLVTDPEERVLAVKPNYRPYWTLPGGMAEDGESPERCAARESAEELGLTLPLGDLLVIDWLHPQGDRPKPLLNFVFDGGTLADPSLIRLQEDELDEFAFLPLGDVDDRFSRIGAPWPGAALRARKQRRIIYLPAERT